MSFRQLSEARRSLFEAACSHYGLRPTEELYLSILEDILSALSQEETLSTSPKEFIESRLTSFVAATATAAAEHNRELELSR